MPQLCSTFSLRCNCRSTNPTPGGLIQSGHYACQAILSLACLACHFWTTHSTVWLSNACQTLPLRCNCRSTNTSPGGPTQSGTGLRQAILARSASQALAAKAAASALKTQTSTQSSLDYSSALSPKPSAALTPQTSLQLTPVSAMTPLHATHTYTPGSFAHSPSLSRGVQEEEEVGAEDLEVAGVTLQCTPPLAEGRLTCSAQIFAMDRTMYK